jgi:predicted acylesterase/phospholipase RssA
LYFVNAYPEKGPPQDLDNIVSAAEGSSLAPIGWGLLYPDFLRTIWPYEPEWDRGRALEESWSGRDPRATGGVEDSLSDWGEKALQSDRPDVIFNATDTETGQPLILSTTDDLPDNMTTHAEFLKTYGSGTCETDVSAVTAARLSAAYPYVSPAARAKEGGKTAHHVVDGGYYDNYGVSSLVDWLDKELQDHKNIKRVLVVRIHGSPTGPGSIESRGKRGWFYQAYAPASTVLNVRSTGQRVHSKVELGLLADKWNRGKRKVDIETATFEFDEPGSPLSWHLTAKQQRKIEEEWKDEVTGDDREEGWDVVERFLSKPAKGT